MIKKIVSLILALLITISLPICVSAEEAKEIPKTAKTIAAGVSSSVWIYDSGSIGTTYSAYDYSGEGVSQWQDVVQICAYNGVVGLLSDGTVVATGDVAGARNIANWGDIMDIDTTYGNTVGLSTSGTVVCAVGGLNTSSWEDIVDVAISQYGVYGLRSDGTVVAAGTHNNGGHKNVSGWRDIVAISAGDFHVVGLKSDGTVVAAGEGECCKVDFWDDIVSIDAGSNYTVGLRSDGTVIATGNNEYNQCGVGGWTDIVEVSAGRFHTIGKKADGSLVAVGSNGYNQCEVN